MPKPLLTGWPLAIALLLIGAPSPRPSPDEVAAAEIRYAIDAGCPVEEHAGQQELLFRCTDAAFGVRLRSYLIEHAEDRLVLIRSERVSGGTETLLVPDSVAIMEYGIGVDE